MSEPVAWRVDTGSNGWYLFSDINEARTYCDDDDPEPLYTADEIERKDAAIAELNNILRSRGWGQGEIDYAAAQEEAIDELVLFIKEILRVEPANLHLFDRQAVKMLVAKHDNTKEG